jgi:Protein of unknown function (DUF3383)
MAVLDTLVEINISQQTAAVPQPSFSIPLIVGPTATSWGPTEFVHSYTSPASMLSDGFTDSSPEYIYALEMFEQALTPSEFLVGYRASPALQVDTITVNTAVSGHNYEGYIQNLLWSFIAGGSDTTATIATAIASAINALAHPTWNAVAVSNVVTITSTVLGQAFTDTQFAADANYTILNTTPNHGIVQDIQNIQSAAIIGNIWYWLLLCSNTDADISQAAAYIETQLKAFMAASADAAIAEAVDTDLLSILGGKNYKRTALIWSPDSDNLGIDAAWVGGQAPAVPGSNNWAYKTLVGISPDPVSDNQRSIIIGDPVAQVPGKNGNIYTTVGGVDITQMGQMVGGQFIDITVGIDWFKVTAQNNIYTQLVQAAKIPYTDKGTTVLISAIKAAIDLGVSNGLIDGASPISITAPPVLSVPTAQRANRVAPTISFSFRLAGAFNAVVVSGTVTV